MSHRIDLKVINISEIARRLGISQSYASEIVRGVKAGPKAQQWLRKMVEESKRTTGHMAA